MPSIDDTSYQDEEANELDADGYALELAVLSVIASRLGKVKKSTTYAEARTWVSKDMDKIDRLMSKGAAIISKASNGIFDRMGDLNDKWAEKFFKKSGNEQKKLPDNPYLSEILETAKKNMGKNASALCNTSVVSIIDDKGNVTPIREAYISIIDNAITAMQSGDETYQQAIAKAVDKLASGGLRVQYASGVTRDLHTAVRTNIMDGYRDTMVALREQQGKEFGANGVEVSAHSNCAPDHQPLQGRQFTNEKFAAEQRKLKRPIGGSGCRHTVFPVIVGTSTKSYTSNELDEIRKRSNQKVTVKGLDGKERTMTRYEATQYQRKIETAIRKARGDAMLKDDAKDAEGAKAANERAKKLTAEYKRITKEAGLTTRMERTKAYKLT